MELLIIPIFVAVFWFVAIRPQQRQQRSHASFLRALGPGDEVVTASGLYGTVAEIDGDIVWLEVAQDLELKIDRTAIARSARPGPIDEDTADADADADAEPEAAAEAPPAGKPRGKRK